MKALAQLDRGRSWIGHQRELREKPLRTRVNVELKARGWGLTEEEMKDFGAELRHSLISMLRVG